MLTKVQTVSSIVTVGCHHVIRYINTCVHCYSIYVEYDLGDWSDVCFSTVMSMCLKFKRCWKSYQLQHQVLNATNDSGGCQVAWMTDVEKSSATLSLKF